MTNYPIDYALLLFTTVLFVSIYIMYEIERSKEIWAEIINYSLNKFNSEFVFSLVQNWFEILKWLMITGAITLVAEKTQNGILRLLMNLTYIFLYIYMYY